MIRLRLLQTPDGQPDDGVPLAAAGSTIGRATDCDVVLHDPMRLVSRRHAWLLPQAPDRALLRCVSTTSGVVVNDEPLAPGAERVVQAGDRLRIGVFEIVLDGDAGGVDITGGVGVPAPEAATQVALASPAPVPTPGAASEAMVAAPFARSRLDAFYDLDRAPDPLAPGSPFESAATGFVAPAAHAAPAPAPPSPPAVPPAPAVRTAPRAAVVPPEPVTLMAPTPARPLAPTGPVPAPPAYPSVPPVHAPAPAVDAADAVLWQAFVAGAGLDPARAPSADPARMAQVGRLLRVVAEGTLALLQDRVSDRFDQRAGGTQFVAGRRNPLDFASDGDDVLRLLLSIEPWPGLLDPVQALQHAYRGLRAEQRALVPAIHEAVQQLLDALDVEAADGAAAAPRGLAAHWPAAREAQQWRRHVAARQAMRDGLGATFAAAFAPALRRALLGAAGPADGTDPLPGRSPAPR